MEDLNKPLVITYCNKYKTNNYENTRRLVETLEKNNWDYMVLGEGEEWKGFTTKMIAYKNYLNLLNPEKIVVISDAHDVYCIRNSQLFINDFKLLNKNIIVSMELYAEGSLIYDPNINYVQVTWLGPYFEFNNIDYNKINRKFVNSGLIAGYAKDILEYFNWSLKNNYIDDQKALGAYINTFPNTVYTDLDANFLHTTGSFICGGLNSHIQVSDSPSINELIGQKSYFLHIPGLNFSPGQKFLYESIYKVLQFLNYNVVQKIYENYDLINFKKYYQNNN